MTLRTIGGIQLRELQRKLPQEELDLQKNNFSNYDKALTQQRKDKNKIYSLHEPDVYCAGKGKDHTPYEYGKKACLLSVLLAMIKMSMTQNFLSQRLTTHTSIDKPKSLQPL